MPGGAPPPVKKANPVVWLGLGCGALLLLGSAGAAWFYFSVFKPAQEVEHAMTAASGLGATVSVTDAGVVVKLPGFGEVSAPASPTPNGVAPSGAATPGATATATATSSNAAPTPTLVLPTPSSGLGTGGPSCDAAAACCKAMASKAGGQAQTVASCDALKASPEFACAQALATYKKMAPLVGVTCP